MARLAAHEIDHLDGMLYTNRMRDRHPTDTRIRIPGTGHAWTYQ
jgi:peptide deformylase